MNTTLKGPIDSIFLVFLALMGSVGFKLLGCPLQDLLQNNVWARQFTYFIVVLFTSSFLDDGTNPPLVHFRNANLGGTNNTLNIDSTVGVNTVMGVNDAMNVTLIHGVNASTAYVNALTIEGASQTVSWTGGAAPADGGSSGVDIYSFTIIKTASATYTVIGNQTRTS